MLLDILQSRRSIRKFQPKQVEKALQEQLVQSALLVASSRGIRPWELIVLDIPEIIQILSASKEHGSAFMKDAPLVIAVLGIPGESDVWIEDTSIAASNILLAAEDLGLGACWVQIRCRNTAEKRSSEEYVREVLGISDTRSVECLIALGHPAEQKSPSSLEELPYQKVFWNRHGRT